MAPTLNEYQEFTRTTARYNKQFAIPYTTLGLAGESGEVADKVKKVFRDDDGNFTAKKREEIAKEIGDLIWYASRLADELGYTLQEVIEMNIQKLTKRMEEGKIHGSGDNR